MTMTAQKTYFDRGDYTLRELSRLTGKSIRQLSRKTSKPRTEYLQEAKQRHNKVIELYQNGKAPKQIAAESGYSLSTVYRILKNVA